MSPPRLPLQLQTGQPRPNAKPSFTSPIIPSPHYNPWADHESISAYIHSFRPFSPCFLFFYGTLRDADVLSQILSLPSPPTLEPATLKADQGFKMMMWGMYPTLLPPVEGKAEKGEDIIGVVWKVETEEQFSELQDYESDAYDWCECECDVEGGEAGDEAARRQKCRVFVWAGERESEELEEVEGGGGFDLEGWRRDVKGWLFG